MNNVSVKTLTVKLLTIVKFLVILQQKRQGKTGWNFYEKMNKSTKMVNFPYQ